VPYGKACDLQLQPRRAVIPTVRKLYADKAELKPDVIIVDVAMPVLNGLDAGR